ncbi:DNA polymerase I [Anaerolentibacter hominis]|uniref:DNA polymerase I n=1 Tax=Anaerolentibacter hominis TaxID=3079009 RepID=UPI0031B882E0
MESKIVLIDGHSILNRAFYGVPELTNSEGLHTNAVYGFLNIMFKILEEEKPEYLTVAFDVKDPTFRHKMFAEYKGTRKPMPDALHEQVPVMKEVLHAMGIRTVEMPGLEADDILGTLARQAEGKGYKVSLVSGDRDLLQLASEKIKIRIPKTRSTGTEVEDYNTKEVVEKYGVTPEQIIDLKGLMGDASDNIPGVPGIGEKTASKIVAQFHSIEEAYEHLEEVKPPKAREALRNNHEQALLSKTLATIKTDCDLNFEVEDGRITDFYNEASFGWFQKLEFKSFLSRFTEDMTRNESLEENFETISEPENIQSVFEEALGEKEAVGLFIPVQEKDVLGVALSLTGRTVFIPAGGEVTGAYLTERLTALLENRITFSMPDVKSALPYLNTDRMESFFDCGVAAYLLNPIKSTYFCEDMANDYLNFSVPSYSNLFGKEKPAQVLAGRPDEAARYFCYQAYTAARLAPVLTKRLDAEGMEALFREIEMPLVLALYELEQRGIRVKREELSEYGAQLTGRILELEQEIYGMVGEEFNINSPKQLGVILFDKLGLPFAKKTKTGYSTSADILEKLKCEHPVIGLILEYRQLTKLKSTYADGLAAYINPSDQRIHGTFNQTITATGRLSSTEPNLQNIPIRMELGRQIRKVFVPEDGYVFLDADYSQIELRVLAHMSGDEALIEAYRQDQDIHRITASKVFHMPLEEVTDAQRRNAKAVNFGIVYGISSFGLGQDLGITRKEAERYIDNYFKTYPKVKEFLDGLVKEGKEKGCVYSMFHRKRPIPELSSGNFMQRSFGERVAMNSPIQGTAADIIKIAMIRVNDRLKEKQMKSRLILQVHDELLVETHRCEIDLVRSILLEEMEHAADLKVPLIVEVSQGDNWYEAK